MLAYIYDDLFLEHGVPWHPENAERLQAIVQRLRDTGLWSEMTPLDFAPARREQLLWVHEDWYLEDLEQVSRQGGEALDPDTIATEKTWEAACLAAGGCIAAAETLMASPGLQALCLVRPPGHHALPHRAMGFCFLNNCALAVEAALRSGAERVALFDWDAHHGNGLQEIFYPRGEVLYMSLHQRDLFPGTGTIDELGVDAGLGLNVNIALPGGARDEHYLRAWEQVFEPVLRRFTPDLLILVAGYDAHWRDSISHLALTAEVYHELTRRALAVAEQTCAGRVQAILAGGYDLPSLALSVENTVLALLGRLIQEPDQPPPPLHSFQRHRIEEYLEHAIIQHRKRLGLGT